MDQPAGPAGRTGTEVALVNHEHAVSGGSEVLGGTGAVDACTDDGDIKVLALQTVEGRSQLTNR